MDGSFLSDESVIQASRDFVCIRVAMYEDAEEAKVLRKIYTRGGDLENTVFAMLSPDGKKHLSRPGRKPYYRSPSRMAAAMRQMVRENYSSAPGKRWSDRILPEMKSLELAINVASCDSLPTIVAIGKSEAELVKLRKQLVPVAWNDQLAGQFVFASVRSGEDLRAINGLDRSKPEGVYLLEPDTYGMSGKVMAKIDVRNPRGAQNQISRALAQFQPPSKNHRRHVASGFQLGLRWETAIPVTDKAAANAAARLWSKD